jgi:hypothetical protein
MEAIKKTLDKVIIFLTRNEEELKLEKLFDSQMDKLVNFGVDEKIISDLRKQRRKVTAASLYSVFCPRYLKALPFFPVFPKEIWRDLFGKSFFRICFRSMFDIEPEEVLKLLEDDYCPDKKESPYFVFGFEPGNEKYIEGLDIKSASWIFKKLKLRPLSAAEIMSMLLVYSDFYKDGEKIMLIPNRRKNSQFIYWYESSFRLGEFEDSSSYLPEAAFPVYWVKGDE